MATKLKPDWNNGSSCTGGQLHEIPKPWVFEYPGERKRRVSFTMISWVGYAPGAIHWSVTIEEEGNSIWHSKEGNWTTPWKYDFDDPMAKKHKEAMERLGSLRFEAKFYDEDREDALRWIRCIFRKFFSEETHEFIDSESHEVFKFEFSKEEKPPKILHLRIKRKSRFKGDEDARYEDYKGDCEYLTGKCEPERS